MTGEKLAELVASLCDMLTNNLPSNILKASLSTISKLLDNDQICSLLSSQMPDNFCPAKLLKSLYHCEFLDRCNDVDHEEVVLLTI